MLNARGFGRFDDRDADHMIRRIQFGHQFDVLWDRAEIYKINKMIHYSNRKQLDLHKKYLPQEAVDLAVKRIRSRLPKKSGDYITTGFNFGTGSKKDVKQTGDCLCGIGFYILRKENRGWFQVFWRSTEFTRRWPADLEFLSRLMENVEAVTKISFSSARLTIASGYTIQYHYPLWSTICSRFKGIVKNAKALKTNTAAMRRFRDGGKTFKYRPTATAYAAYQKNKKSKMSPLFTTQDGTVRLYNGRGVVYVPPSTSGRGTGKEGRRS